MNSYKFNIVGMHCNACTELIKMELEDAGINESSIDLDKKEGIVKSSSSIEQIKDILDKTFQNLEKYKYSNLHLV